ncbi:hypothetical protein [Armatimonas sp.]|uniref:hypothetical protein n=1 Tax=Armatimonas sp. TaxID=1872638 RepID=UPI0037529107
MTVFLVALIPVLLIGIVLVELLLWHAPRRGKRSDLKSRPLPPRRIIRVVTPSGDILTGEPERIVASLARQGFFGAYPDPDPAEAWHLLDSWRAVGRIQLQVEWR